jgi:putative chitinase
MPGTKFFYDTIRPALFRNALTGPQVTGIESILKYCAGASINDHRFLAYILATIYHECSKTMQPIEESGKGANHDYGKQLKMGNGPGKRIPYATPKQLYYGRGYSQLTWYEHYEAQGKRLGLDLLNHPEFVLQADVAANIIIHGMIHGDFTGHHLAEYFTATAIDFVNARKIINGLDHADLIAGYARTFFAALTEPPAVVS